MNQPLTLLQRGVIQRLRDAGFIDLASLASAAWSDGKAIEWTPATEGSEFIQGPDGGEDAWTVGNIDRNSAAYFELRADFEKANAQATQPG